MRGRLTLLPGLRRLWRGERTLQLGTDSGAAVLLDVDQPSLIRVLDLLDGSRTERGVQRDAADLGVPEATSLALVDTLHRAKLLVATDDLMPPGMPERQRRRLRSEAAALAMAAAGPAYGSRRPAKPAEALRRRAAAAVLICGPARLSAPIGALLAASGIGHVDITVTGRVSDADPAVGGILPDDAGRARRTAATEAIHRAAPDVDTRAMREGAATFVVQIGPSVPAELLAYGYARRCLPHLLVEERDHVLLVGPLVPRSGSPCLNCLDLHRRDRDPAWPAITAQLATAGDEPAPVSIATITACTGFAAGQVLAYIDGGSVATVGGSFEINASMPARRRSWTPHPRCDCRVRPRTAGSPDCL